MKARHYPNVLASFYSTMWCIDPDKLDQIEMAMHRIITGRVADGWQMLDSGFDAADEPGMRVDGDTAVVPIRGVITPRPSVMSSGGTSASRIGAGVDKAVANNSVRNIVFDIDSPGGDAKGIQELGEKIRAAGKVKPTISSVNHLAASAGYWLGSQANQIVISPSGEAGNIGVLYRRMDQSALLEKEGIKINTISSGKYKAEGNPASPMTPEEQSHLQARSNEIYSKFLHAVASSRGKPPALVESTFGNGRTLFAEEAVKVGMADRIATFEQVMGELKGASMRGRQAQAARASLARY